MNDLATLITAVTAAIAAIGALLVGIRNSRKVDDAREKAAIAKAAAEDSKREVIKVGDSIFELGKQVDGRLTELLALTQQAAHAAGVLEGRAEGKAK